LSSRLQTNGIQEMPASVTPIRKRGKRTTTPVETMLMTLAMIENVCDVEWRASSVSNPWLLNGNTGEVTVTACRSTGRPAFCAAS
jgi:hypothetical protein